MKQLRNSTFYSMYISGLPVIKDKTFNLSCPKCMDKNVIEYTPTGFPIRLIIEFKDDYGIYITSSNMLKLFNNKGLYHKLSLIYDKAVEINSTIRIKLKLCDTIFRGDNFVPLYKISIQTNLNLDEWRKETTSIDKYEFFRIINYIIT